MRHTYALKSLQVKSSNAAHHSTFTIGLNIIFNSNVYFYTKKKKKRIGINGASMIQNEHLNGPVCEVPAVAYTLALMPTVSVNWCTWGLIKEKTRNKSNIYSTRCRSILMRGQATGTWEKRLAGGEDRASERASEGAIQCRFLEGKASSLNIFTNVDQNFTLHVTLNSFCWTASCVYTHVQWGQFALM